MTGNNACTTNPCYESFKILRGVPLCNTSGDKNVWFAVIQTPIGNDKTKDPQNYIKVSPLDTLAPSPGGDTNFSGLLMADSTRLIVQNLVNNNFIDITQEDAYLTFVSNDAGGVGPTSTSSCAVTAPCVLPDGIVQFLALIQIAPSCTWLGTGLVITISPLNNNLYFKNCTFGNWCPFSFTIGNCNSQSATASLLVLTCSDVSGAGFFYSANYANVRFTLLNKQKCATGGAKKACFLGVDSLDKGTFLVFFGQERLIGTTRILLISPIVDLKAIVWQPVFIITTNTPLSLTA